ncbi:RagB/SusD family nutrient uptake outer membrane protein [Dysgonomonas sp. GY617]|uniref:RagB/SusD family nutrient uptake outer membrane protein n=1 Tax=Dysgonomonas sp. GY617 TaxID=2780420 RepID=UPI0018845D3C|nr:RagB/SusD family nutrient uptake outer membrane protein [Dysgonomonas sp. GY617]MBF0575155.1 RagB/SusD family nutrient uptake outer membrane protein [Dysgonomonas sp. GY617]
MDYNIKKYTVISCLLSALVIMGSSCNDFLDREPLDQVTPGVYFKNEADLEAYTIGSYDFPSHGQTWGLGNIITADENTDNMATTTPSTSRWAKGQWRVPESSSDYSFTKIRNANFFFEQVLPKWKNGEIAGTPSKIDHYIGEMYMIRAWEYFLKLKIYGDFPIVKNTLKDNKDQLIEASKRKPRNEVARFIIQDLDSAISLLSDNFKDKRRITKNAALLLKSRVALYEASWLTYHNGTAHVPGGPNWPGAQMDYNKGFTINIDSEIDYFLTAAMDASKAVADNVQLTANTGVYNPQGDNPAGWNPYFDMFSDTDMSKYSEVLFWRAFDKGLNLTHSVGVYIRGGGNNGVTKGFIDSYLMKNGLPIYASGSGYSGDKTIEETKNNRDGRLQLFVFGEKDRLLMTGDPTRPNSVFYNMPEIINLIDQRDVTGYRMRKCYNYDPTQSPVNGMNSSFGSIVFRGVEAYLNYIEASYMKKKSIDGTAALYWKEIRRRANVDEDYSKTIAATNLDKENDWAKYSAGQLVDATLYNIRRERRNEFMGEAMRWDDLKRWRALDQVNNYVIEGFNLWDQAFENAHYKEEILDPNGKPTGKFIDRLIEPDNAASGTPNVSSRKVSKYLRPYQIISTNNLVFNGYTWSRANYLTPIPAYEIRITASNMDDASTSPLYQNPYWPTKANESALE